ncbi:hypothetical protein BT93_L1597 [Corymbia citriodora subsp. variegata]|uniref:Uncharacterized protein n=1 Tax=Corymbia citriodora subsp. variegata TaxID=360336 RepID=A0A8T0CRN3_CORYI|nr:hypothetical protein BT93_L1597 [Corymbia citriodora subsp. variegata]
MGRTYSVAAFVEPRIVVIFFSIRQLMFHMNSVISCTFGSKQCRSLFPAAEMLNYSRNSTQTPVGPAEAKKG